MAAAAAVFLFLGAVMGGVAFLAMEFLLTPFVPLLLVLLSPRNACAVNPNKSCHPDAKRSLPFTCSKVVPLSLTMRFASLRGTLQLHIKPPPSDQLWFGFTSMPEIDWNLDPEMGDQKISTGDIALLLKVCFKDAICEFLVVPNFECICIPWMFDEKDDWVLLKVAPFKWVHQGAGRDIGDLDACNSQFEENENKHADIDENKANTCVYHSTSLESLSDFEASQTSQRTSVSSDQSSHGNMLEMETLPESKETQESSNQSRVASPMITSKSTTALEGQKTIDFEVDPKPRKVCRKLSMKEMGKLVGDKIEEKWRHIGEKGRYIAEKCEKIRRHGCVKFNLPLLWCLFVLLISCCM